MYHFMFGVTEKLMLLVSHKSNYLSEVNQICTFLYTCTPLYLAFCVAQ